MKNHIIGIIILSCFFACCEEEPLPIVFEEPPAPLLDTTYRDSLNVPLAQPKVVVFEDYTGVRCVPCPTGHVALKQILDNNPGRVAGVAVHPGADAFPQSFPFASQEDFNTEWGPKLMSIIGKPNGIPHGTADRVLKSNTVSNWESNANQQLAVPNPVNVDMTVISFDDASKTLRFEIRIEITEDLDEPLLFSTMLTEDNIEAWQETPQGTDEHYIHNHILRDMPNFSENLNPNNIPEARKGRVFIKQYEFKFEDHWKPNDMHLVGLVHRSIEVLQADEVSIK